MTPEQLRQNAAAMLAFADGKPVQVKIYNGWTDASAPVWDLTGYEFRPKPQPVTRPWSKSEDVPGPVCWIRHISGKSELLIVGIWSDGVSFCQISKATWAELEHHKYSTDRITWNPCVVEEQP